jgi:tetratricopeptide (TPR) repeat protein
MDSTAVPDQPTPQPPAEPEPAAESGTAEAPLPQELMDALLGAAGEEQPQPDVGAENLAAAASTEPVKEQSIHDDLDPLFEHGDQEREESAEDESAPVPEPVVEAAREAPVPHRPKPSFNWSAFLQQNAPRMTASLAAGLLVGITTFLMLNTIRMRHVDPAELARGHVSELALALAQARDLMDQDAYLRAAAVLDGPLSRANAGEVRDAAEFVYLEARFRGLQPAFGTPNFEELVRDIDDIVSRVPNHPRAPEALYWKAKLYEASDLTRAANDVYANIISNYSDMQGFDVILVEAAGLNLKIREPRQTAAYMQRLLLNYPDSPLAGEARLLLGDAYAQAGMYDDARTLYVRTAQAGSDAASRNAGIQRLGKLAFSQGNYDAAVRELANYLRTATTTEGSDEVYLMLAQAYREQGDLEMARNTLMDLLNFLPESDVTPRAYVAITDVYEALGERKQAMRMARQGAVMFPDNPVTLENKGRMLGLSGNPVGAAEALLAADESGANNPALLLTAARHYVTAGHTGRALATYERVRATYPRLDEAFTADVEAAQLRYRLAEVGEAVQTLEDLVNATSQTEQRVKALEALTDIYTDLELSDRLRQTALSLAAEARDPETLGKSARALFAAGALEEGREVMDRIALGQLPDREAFALLTRFGTSLLEVDPNRGLDMLEQAHTAYPAQPTVADDIALMDAYISADRPAAARRMVMQIDTHVRENPIDNPYLVEAAIAWGDFLFNNEDYRMAADAYQMAMEAAEPTPLGILIDRDVDPRWAQYQRANALFELEDFDASLDLLNAIASSDAPWAEEAAVKAEYARIEQRLRGAPGVRTGTQG